METEITYLQVRIKVSEDAEIDRRYRREATRMACSVLMNSKFVSRRAKGRLYKTIMQAAVKKHLFIEE